MSKRLDVMTALAALLKAAAPQCDHHALADDADRPKRIGPHGTIVLRDGDPGEPEIDLCPPTYHFQHRFPVEISAYASSEPLRVVLDRMAGWIAAAVQADRTLGGLCNHIDVGALELVDLMGGAGPGSATQKGAVFEITADYSTTTPLN